MSKSLKFLSGGGEMGALMRAYDWESSPIGQLDKWPQSLLTTLGILLNSKFPMFLFWGPHHICFYNDAFRPSLGNEGKHPSMLGIKGEEAWPEIWQIIKPLIDNVLTDGEATWSEDQLIPIYRNGKIEDVYWTFSYSPVKDESGMPAGVFVTCTETTDKVNNFKKLAESNNQLNFAIEATQLGTWDFNLLTNKFIGNHYFKEWFDLPNGEEFDINIGVNLVAENDRSHVSQAIQRALEYESGGFYDLEYSIINPVTKQERIVRAKGKAWFGEDKKAYRFNGTLQDITQEAIARRKIEENEQRFRNLILQAPVLIATYRGPSFIIETVNKSALEIWGKSYEQVINKPLFEVSPELEEGLKTILNDIYTTGDSFIDNEIKVRLKRQGKPEMAYFNLLYQPLRGSDNEIYGIILIGTEVTEGVNARKKIEESEQRFAAAVAAVEGILWTNNGKGEMEGEQAGWAALTGQSYKEYQGYGWVKIVHPDDAQPTIDAWNIAVNERKIFVFDHRLKMHNGHWGHFSIRAIPILNSDGSIREWVGVHTNITQKRIAEEVLKESEEKFRGLVETLPHLVWITDEKGEAVYASKSWQEYSGLNPYETGNWKLVVYPDDLADMTNIWITGLAIGKIYHAEARLKNKHGEYRWHVVEGLPILNAEQKITKWIGSFTDIHDQKIKEQQKDEFISIASHEMKTPLTSAKGYLELLLLLLSEQNQTAFLYANKANQAVERLHSLVTELLDVSKIQNGKLNYNISTFDFNEMLDEAIEDIQLTAKNHRLQITGNSLRKIKGDKERLQQVLINLLSNAIKYSPNADKVFIKVEQQHAKIQVSVQDFGIGMSNQHLDKIFERYYRVQEHAVYFQGLGIGLHISSNIIQRHEGKMWAESEPDKGSTFHFTLPL
jgi:PAS domain S-box-containing protein